MSGSKYTTHIAAAAFSLFALSACGGGGGGSAPASNPVPHDSAPTALPPSAPPPLTHVTIFVDGDSTNRGCNADSNPQCLTTWAYDPPSLMQADFDAALGSGAVTVLPGAMPGSTLQDDLSTGGPTTVPLATRLMQLPMHADIVISNSEINDQYVGKNSPGTYGVWVGQWISTVTTYGAKPVLEEPNPIWQAGYDIPMTDQFVAEMHSVAAAANVPVLPTYDAFKMYPVWNIALIGSDRVHPNAAGYQFKEANYFPVLLPIVKAMLGRS